LFWGTCEGCNGKKKQYLHQQIETVFQGRPPK
jgi:hypothetical protein